MLQHNPLCLTLVHANLTLYRFLHTSDFEKIKASHAKRKEVKKLGTKFTGSLPPMRGNGGGAGGLRGGGGMGPGLSYSGKRQPATQEGGTMTKRATVPTNRTSRGGGGSSGTGNGYGATGGAVGGIAGIRALQAGRGR